AQSTAEWTPSASIEALPVTAAATNLDTAITPFAASATRTVFEDSAIGEFRPLRGIDPFLTQQTACRGGWSEAARGRSFSLFFLLRLGVFPQVFQDPVEFPLDAIEASFEANGVNLRSRRWLRRCSPEMLGSPEKGGIRGVGNCWLRR